MTLKPVFFVFSLSITEQLPMSSEFQTFMAAPSCAAKNCLHKGAECARRKCIAEIRKFFAILDKKVKKNITVHEAGLKQYNAQLASAKNASERKMAKRLLSLTEEYLEMYRSYATLTTEQQKLVWFAKYFMT